MSGPARILCIGKDSGILRSRCAILKDAGYQAQAVFVAAADNLLQQESFDLLILSVILSEEEREHIATIVAGATPILQVTKTILAFELLAEVEQLLRR
jgi:DNA-binding response OmpR family regulator